MLDSMTTMGGLPLADDDAWADYTDQLDLSDDQHRFWLAETGDGDPVGLVEARLITPFMVFQPRHILHIHAVMVTESHRHKGIGRALIDTALAWGREAGCVEAQLSVFPDNPARTWYTAMGFETVELKMRHSL